MNIVLVLALTIFALLHGEVDAKTCEWSGCEGLMKFGQAICNNYKLGVYTGKTSNSGCGWDSTKVECCKPDPTTCKLTKSCWGMAYGGNYACSYDFGSEYIKNGQSSQDNCGFSLTRHMCCK